MSIPRVDAAHLLRRAGFGGLQNEIDALATSTNRAAAVSRVLDFSANPPGTNPGVPVRNSTWEDYVNLQRWWLERMRTAPATLQEKLTLFWHGHFAAVAEGNAYFAWEQNDLFRNLGAGSFRDLTQAISINPLMLLFLDGAQNWKDAPNQNYARELMELFTLGVDQYSYDDIIAAARAWTGHSLKNWDDETKPIAYAFYPWGHDYDNKTFFGITRNWDGPEIVDEICYGQGQATMARFIARKMWSFFAYPNPSDGLVQQLADSFVSSNLQVRELLRAIFLNDEFYSTTARQGLLRTPVEFVAAAIRYTGVSAMGEMNPNDWLPSMSQELFAPPNVAGWKQNAYWISPAISWAKGSFARAVAEAAAPYGPPGTLGTFLVETMSMTVPQAVQRAFDAFGIDQPSANTRVGLETWLAQERASRSWEGWFGRDQIRNLIVLVLLSPESQLA